MNVHGGYKGNEKEMIDFSVNIPPLEYTIKIQTEYKEYLYKSLNSIDRYPDMTGEKTAIKLSSLLDISSENIILGNGATELIYLLARSLKPKNVLILEPTFTEYQRAFEMYGCEVHHLGLDLNQLDEIDVTPILKSIETNKVDLLVLCNPNNPTGHLYDSGLIDAILNKNIEGLKLMIDESFMSFMPQSIRTHYEQKDRKLIRQDQIIFIRSMTKTYSIPGIRLGYAIGNASIIRKMYQLKEPWTMNVLALDSCLYLMEKAIDLEKLREWCQTESAFMYHTLIKNNHINVFKSNTNFLLIQILNDRVHDVNTHLIDNKIFLRSCSDFYGLDTSYLRIALKTHDENKILCQSIEEALK